MELLSLNQIQTKARKLIQSEKGNTHQAEVVFNNYISDRLVIEKEEDLKKYVKLAIAIASKNSKNIANTIIEQGFSNENGVIDEKVRIILFRSKEIFENDEEAEKILEEARAKAAEQAKKNFEGIPAAKGIDYVTLEKEYGNNYFELRTIDNNTEIILAGVLKELPEFSCSTEWEEGPGGTIGKKVKDYVNDDTLQAFNFLGGSDYSPLLAMDALTERAYAKTSYESLELNFRIYSNQVIGSKIFTSPDIWIKSLLKYTSPDASNGTISKNVLDNLRATVESAGNLAKQLKEIIKDDEKDEEEKADQKKTMDSVFTNINNAMSRLQENRYGDKRIYSEANGLGKFGAKLFELRIMPFIFKQNLKVYISGWSVNPSSECFITSENKHEHVYYDFKITCCMDQIPSKDTWKNILGYTNVPSNPQKDKNN